MSIMVDIEWNTFILLHVLDDDRNGTFVVQTVILLHDCKNKVPPDIISNKYLCKSVIKHFLNGEQLIHVLV